MKNQAEYISSIKEGDQLAFEHFVNYYSKDLLYYAQCITKSKQLAEEVVSDIFYDVWCHRHRLDEIKNLKAWLVTLTHNKAISYLRKSANRTSLSLENLPEYNAVAPLCSPDEQIISREEMDKINRIIDSLPHKCRIVFILAKIEKLQYKEISQIMNISVKTINIHIAKAIEKIAKGLNENS